MSDGILVRLWRSLFARDSHVDCKAALQLEREAREWEREALVKLLHESFGKTLELVEPGINYRFGIKPSNERKPVVKVEPPRDEVEMLPGLN